LKLPGGGFLFEPELLADFLYPATLRRAGLFVFCGTVRQKTSRFSARVYLCFATVIDRRCKLRGIAPFGVRTFLPALLKIAKTEQSLELRSHSLNTDIGNLKKGWAILRPSKTSVIIT